jgi:lipopolysaccharide export system permease protein
MNKPMIVVRSLYYLSFVNPWRGSKLETYIVKLYLTALLMSLGVVASLIFLIDFVDISKSLGVRGDLNSFSVLMLVLLRSPNTILILLPFVFLSASLVTFVSLNRRSELIAMRASGVSAWRFIMPSAGLSFFLGLTTITVFNPLASVLGGNYDRMKASIEQADLKMDQTLFLRQGDENELGERKQVVIRAGAYSAIAAQLKDVSFWVYSIGENDIPVFLERIDAKEAYLRNGYWQLKNAYDAVAGEQAKFYDVLTIPSSLKPDKAFRRLVTPESSPFWRLPSIIAQTEASGFTSTDYRLKLHQLLATPLLFAAMAALGAVFSLRLMRLGGIARLIIYGSGLGFLIFFISQILSSMGKAQVIPVELAGWAPALLALLSAASLLVYTEDG